MIACCHPGQQLTAALALMLAGETITRIEETPHVPPGSIYVINPAPPPWGASPRAWAPPGPFRPRTPGIIVPGGIS